MVQPEIDPLHETAGNVTIVIFDEDETVLEAGLAAEFVNFLDKRFAGFVAWMRLTGENKLHRARRMVEQSMQSFLVAEQQRDALGGGQAAREPVRVMFGVAILDCRWSGHVQ